MNAKEIVKVATGINSSPPFSQLYQDIQSEGLLLPHAILTFISTINSRKVDFYLKYNGDTKVHVHICKHFNDIEKRIQRRMDYMRMKEIENQSEWKKIHSLRDTNISNWKTALKLVIQ